MANAASEFGKTLVSRTPEVAGGLLRSIVDFAIDGSAAFPVRSRPQPARWSRRVTARRRSTPWFATT